MCRLNYGFCSNNMERFQAMNTMPLAISTDTEMVHTAFMNQPTLGFIPSFPLGKKITAYL